MLHVFKIISKHFVFLRKLSVVERQNCSSEQQQNLVRSCETYEHCGPPWKWWNSTMCIQPKGWSGNRCVSSKKDGVISVSLYWTGKGGNRVMMVHKSNCNICLQRRYRRCGYVCLLYCHCLVHDLSRMMFVKTTTGSKKKTWHSVASVISKRDERRGRGSIPTKNGEK